MQECSQLNLGLAFSSFKNTPVLGFERGIKVIGWGRHGLLSGVAVGNYPDWQLPGAANPPKGTVRAIYSMSYCIDPTPDIYGPALESRKKDMDFFVGCKHIFGVSLRWQRPDGLYALSFLYSISASLRLSGVQVFRKPVRPFFHLSFLATLGKLLYY